MAMDFKEKKAQFIEQWGKISCNWGVCKGMAQLHALLLISPKPMSSTCIQKELNLSTGGICTYLHELVDWGLIYKYTDPEQPTRKDYYAAEKDMLTVFKQILKNRKRKELDPILALLDDMEDTPVKCPESEEFKKVVADIQMFSKKVDITLDTLLSTDQSWMVNTFLRLVK